MDRYKRITLHYITLHYKTIYSGQSKKKLQDPLGRKSHNTSRQLT